MELKGKVSKKFSRNGLPAIRDEHFDIDQNFISRAIDKDTGQVCFPSYMQTL